MKSGDITDILYEKDVDLPVSKGILEEVAEGFFHFLLTSVPLVEGFLLFLLFVAHDGFDFCRV